MAAGAVVGGRVLTMDPSRRELADGVILFEDGEIVAVGTSAEVTVPEGVEVIDASGHAVIPGLVNAHTHVPQILLRGGPSHDRHLYDWLFGVLYPGLAAYSLEDIRCATRLFAAESLAHGVTTIVDNEDVRPDDMLNAAQATIDALRETGIRAVYARMFADQVEPALDGYIRAIRGGQGAPPSPSLIVPTERVLSDLDELVHRFDGVDDGRIRVWPAPAIPMIVSETALRHSRSIAHERSVMWTVHIAEDHRERDVAFMGAVEYLHAIGVLDSRLLAAHCVDVQHREVRQLLSADAKVSTQPSSNSFLGAGVAPVPDMLDMGVTVGIGTDDANCSDTADVFASMKLLALLHRATQRDASVITPERVVEMATIDGARAIGMDHLIGSIEIGKRADLVLLDLSTVSMAPAWDLCAALVFMDPARAVRTVLVDGRQVVENGTPTFLGAGGEPQLVHEAYERSGRILEQAGLEGRRPWRTTGV